jgi:hypothetical protein
VPGDADFSNDNAGDRTAVTVSLSLGDVTVPFDADAVFVIEPASRSACTTT